MSDDFTRSESALGPDDWDVEPPALALVPDPVADWRVRQLGRSYYVYSDSRRDFARSRPARYKPRGQTLTFKLPSSAQCRAQELNEQVSASLR